MKKIRFGNVNAIALYTHNGKYWVEYEECSVSFDVIDKTTFDYYKKTLPVIYDRPVITDYYIMFISPVEQPQQTYYYNGVEFIAHTNHPQPLTDNYQEAIEYKNEANEWLDKSGWIKGNGAFIQTITTYSRNPDSPIIEII